MCTRAVLGHIKLWRFAFGFAQHASPCVFGWMPLFFRFTLALGLKGRSFTLAVSGGANVPVHRSGGWCAGSVTGAGRLAY